MLPFVKANSRERKATAEFSSVKSGSSVTCLLHGAENALENVNKMRNVPGIEAVVKAIFKSAQKLPVEHNGADTEKPSDRGQWDKLVADVYDSLRVIISMEEAEVVDGSNEARLVSLLLGRHSRKRLLKYGADPRVQSSLDSGWNLQELQRACDTFVVAQIRGLFQAEVESEAKTNPCDGSGGVSIDDVLNGQSTKKEMLRLARVLCASGDDWEKSRTLLETLTDLAVKENKELKLALKFEDLEFQDGPHLGGGAFGTVVRAKWKGIPVAVKILKDQAACLTFKTVAVFTAELSQWKALSACPNIVKLYGTTMDTKRMRPMFVMELCDYSLADYLHRHDNESFPVDFAFIRNLALDVCTGLTFIHIHKIIHRDLKPANILLCYDKSDQRFVAKICDFGVSLTNDCSHTVDDKPCGTIPYMAPEQLQSGPKVSTKTDVYSLGIVLWEVLEREMPWKGETREAIRDAVVNHGKTPTFSEKSYRFPQSQSLVALIVRCLSSERVNRPSANEVYVWLKSIEETRATNAVWFESKSHAFTTATKTTQSQPFLDKIVVPEGKQSSKLLPGVQKEKKRYHCAGCFPCSSHDALPKMLLALAVATVVAVIVSIVVFPWTSGEADELTNSTRSPTTTTTTLSPHIALRNATLSPTVTAGTTFVPSSSHPTTAPTTEPSIRRPTPLLTANPTTTTPTQQPSNQPVVTTLQPTSRSPTGHPSLQPTSHHPTHLPTIVPSLRPTAFPTIEPTTTESCFTHLGKYCRVKHSKKDEGTFTTGCTVDDGCTKAECMAMCIAQESCTGIEFSLRPIPERKRGIRCEIHLEYLTHAKNDDDTPIRDWCYRKTCDR